MILMCKSKTLSALSLPAGVDVTHGEGAEGLPELLSTFEVLIFLHATKY